MHIAQIATSKSYGGTERVIRWLAEELAALGHEVTLYVGSGSAAPATLETVLPSPFGPGGPTADGNACHVPVLEQIRRYSHRYDFVHFHSNNYSISLFCPGIPFVTTLHGHLDLAGRCLAAGSLSRQPTISISDSQRKPLPQVTWLRTIYPGLPQRLLTPVPAEPRYFAFLGCIAPENGVDRAISIARRCGVPIRIAARVDDENRDYFTEKIRPLLDGSSAEHIGELADADKSEFLSGAVALIHPGELPEPFCLAMIEAMACGTPVVAFDRGLAPEIIDDGWTGFIVEDENAVIDVFDQLLQLPRAKIRNRFEQRFTARNMALEYLDVYRSLIDQGTHDLKVHHLSCD